MIDRCIVAMNRPQPSSSRPAVGRGGPSCTGHSGRPGVQRRAWDSNPQLLSEHDISSVAASHSLTLQTAVFQCYVPDCVPHSLDWHIPGRLPQTDGE